MILLGTVLLERNRWHDREHPLIRVSDWLVRARDAGFDGLELWENHWMRADDSARAALLASPIPIKVFNCYARPDRPEDDAALAAAVEAARALRAEAIKFNVGPAPGDAARARDTLVSLHRERLPGVRLRCECHGNTWLETPEAAAAFFATVPAPIEVIVHAFALTPEKLARWFDLLGPRITAIHVHCHDETGRWSGIARHRERSLATLARLRAFGFAGDHTLEFTAGTNEPDETAEAVWRAALDDLAFLRENLPTAG